MSEAPDRRTARGKCAPVELQSRTARNRSRSQRAFLMPSCIAPVAGSCSASLWSGARVHRSDVTPAAVQTECRQQMQQELHARTGETRPAPTMQLWRRVARAPFCLSVACGRRGWPLVRAAGWRRAKEKGGKLTLGAATAATAERRATAATAGRIMRLIDRIISAVVCVRLGHHGTLLLLLLLLPFPLLCAPPRAAQPAAAGDPHPTPQGGRKDTAPHTAQGGAQTQ
jgi:hypothetical protein